MGKEQIDKYLAGVEEPKKSTLKALRDTILEIIPDAEQCISYQFPTFKVNGKGIAGFAAFKKHCSYFPMSGFVLNQLERELGKYRKSSGALQFAVDKPLPKTLVKKLIKLRLSEAFPKRK